jgi:hypothetical protein
MINRILIPSRYTFFFGSLPAKNYGVKRDRILIPSRLSVLGPEQFQDG